MSIETCTCVRIVAWTLVGTLEGRVVPIPSVSSRWRWRWWNHRRRRRIVLLIGSDLVRWPGRWAIRRCATIIWMVAVVL